MNGWGKGHIHYISNCWLSCSKWERYLTGGYRADGESPVAERVLSYGHHGQTQTADDIYKYFKYSERDY